ncbi:uncharacterized protein LOC126791057 [Argentina anserina]|uniref:uncharacterized protein LOC126791057 n=1 Tax=Argentina anserina TaxID=57926 RepID=UPI0021765C40|nr:uncharacterized protein LOC126791057 [Potentilla anserina]
MATGYDGKIIRGNMSRWSGLPKDLCQHILSGSTLKGINRFKAVCPSWSAAADEMIKSPTFTCSPETTWLVLPGDMNKGEAIDGSSRFYSLDGNFYNSNTNMPEETREAICFGSSHGWLVLLNDQLDFMLTTPFLPGIQLSLPPLKTFPDILSITYHKGTTYAYNIVDHFKLERKTAILPIKEDFTSVKDLASKLMRAKAVLSSRPTFSSKDQIGVMVIYMFGLEEIRYNSLAFCTTSDHKWTKLEERKWYMEIMGRDNEFFVLMKDYTVDVWNFGTSSIPMKKMEIKPDACALLAGPTKKCHKVYLIKTAGTGLMLVAMDYHMSLDRLHVYQMEGETPVWKEVESIGNNVLVLGSNNSRVMSHHESLRCDSDSIYYVKKSNSGSYNLKVFSLKDKSNKEVCELPVDFEPLAFSGL